MAFTPTTWNPADKGSACTLSNANLTAQCEKINGPVRSVFGASTGKWYWEITNPSGRAPVTGVGTAGASLGDWPGSDANGWSYYLVVGTKIHNGGQTVYGAGWDYSPPVIGVALDMDAGTLAFFLNGVSMGVAFTGIAGTVYAMTAGDANGDLSGATANFGATAFVYTPPTGFNAGFGPSLAVPTLSGTVRDAINALAARKVAAYREDTNALVGTTTSDATTGAYSIETPADTAHTLVFYPALGESLNALVRRGVLPIES